MLAKKVFCSDNKKILLVKIAIGFFLFMLLFTVISRITFSATAIQVKTELPTEMNNLAISQVALHQSDSGEYYVYTVKEVNTILGKQLVADRAYVDILRQDDNTVVIENLSSDREVIVESSRDLENKDRIRRWEP